MADKIYFSDSDIKRHGEFQDMENTVNPDRSMDIAKYHWEAESNGVRFDILASLMCPDYRNPGVKRYIISGICIDDHNKAFTFIMDYQEMVNIYVSPETGDIWGGNNYVRFKLWSNTPEVKGE